MSEQWEEVPGSRTVQPTQILPGTLDEIAYRDLKPGEVIQAGDQWRAESGQWSQIDQSLIGQTTGVRARRPYNITELLKRRDQAAHEYRLAREALTREQAVHRTTRAHGQQACKERDKAEHALQMARAALEEAQAARELVIAERNEAERLLAETRMERDKAWTDQKAIQAYRDAALQERNEAERLLTQARAAQERIITERDEWRRLFEVEHEARKAVIAERNEAKQHLEEERELHAITAKDRGRVGVELNECQQQRQHLQAALEELQRRRDAAEANFQTNTLTVAEVVDNILSALEIASHALEYLADVGVNEEPGHYCGFSAAIAVVKQIKESAK